MSNSVTYLNRTPICLHGLWLGVVSRVDTKNDTCLYEIGLHAQNMITSLGSMINIIGGHM